MTDLICRTHSGEVINFNNFDPSLIKVEDIAVALSRLPRYCGHTKDFYSVAQHSVLMADYILRETKDYQLAKQALLHEAGEAYALGDVHGVFKRSLGKEAVQKIKEHDRLIHSALGIYPIDEYVDEIDSRILITEMKQLFVSATQDKHIDFKDDKYYGCEPLPINITPWPPNVAWNRFMYTYETLTVLSHICKVNKQVDSVRGIPV